MFMQAAASPPTTSAWALAGRFARFIGGLREAMATGAEHNQALMDLAARLWNRLTEAAERFAAIAAHPVARSRRRPAESARLPADARPFHPAAPRRTLPRSLGWLVLMAPETEPFGLEFADLLEQAEMTALLEAAPRLWRVLRPLCRMLAIIPSNAPPPVPPMPDPAPRRQAAAARDPARPRPQSEAAPTRDHLPHGFRPPLFGR